VSIKGHAPKHKVTTTTNTSSQQTGSAVKQSAAAKPLDFKQLMKIARENKSGNRSKQLVQQTLSSNKKATVPSTHEKTPTANTQKPVKRAEQAGTKQPQSAVLSKQISTNHKRLPNNRSIPQQRTLSGTTTKQAARIGDKTGTKPPPNIKLKTGSFYQSSDIGSDWSDIKKTLRKPQLHQRHNGFNISGSWISELGLNRLPTDLDSDYEDDDDLSDFVASDDEDIDKGNMEDYSAAIRDIFGYDKRKLVDTVFVSIA